MAQKKGAKSCKPKKKVKVKKLGLAKFLHPQGKPKDNKQQLSEDNADDQPQSNRDKRKAAAVRDETKLASTDFIKRSKNLSLVERCKLQMSSSLLRLVDESLYTSDTKHLTIDRDKFIAYHEAYAQVCDKWPVKPIDYIVKFIKKRLLTRKPVQRWKFADIGCGREPLLKSKLPPKANVVSIDVVSAHKDVIEANMERLPMADESINCSVYSLSLMAKNLGHVILEGKRILKIGGSMLIVEVTSRFENNERKFIERLTKLGLKHKSSSIIPPNGYFTFFHFTKVNSDSDYSSSNLNIKLKPCSYKTR